MVSAGRAFLICFGMYWACARSVGGRAETDEFYMRCACGERNVDEEEKENCNESAKLEDTEE